MRLFLLVIQLQKLDYSEVPKDLLEILKNRQAHYLKSDSLTDVTSYKGTRWIEHPMVIWSLVTLPLLALYMCFIHQS